MKFALVGNQNCGKTTLFNALTGASQRVGNFPGVTIEKKTGIIKNMPEAEIVDLPGIYSLSPYSPEEIVTRDYITENKIDCIINIVDATNLERNLYLTMQVLELGIPTVVALNMMDEVKANGFVIDIKGIESSLGTDITPISANKGQGIQQLVKAAAKAAQCGKAAGTDFFRGAVRTVLDAIAGVISTKAEKAGVSKHYAAARIFEGDKLLEKKLALTKSEICKIESAAVTAEKALDTDREAAMSDARYSYINSICRRYYKRGPVTSQQKRSIAIDKFLTHKIFGLPIFFAVMFLIFWLTFGAIGQPLANLLENAISGVQLKTEQFLIDIGTAGFVRSLVIDGIFAGVGSILSFLPLILVLFLLLSVLEDTGYMARVAFIMDKLMRGIGLSGRSFVPMLLGFGCTVPAVMATRTLPGERDRKTTILLVPFMSCSAKLPIYTLFTGLFFKENAALVMMSLYVLGIAAAIVCGLFLKKTSAKTDETPFIIELPSYRLPLLRSVLMQVWQRAADFVKKALTVILLASVAVWLLKSFDMNFALTDRPADSILAAIGKLAAPVFAPLGFGDWRIAAALIVGLTAKETIVSTLTVLVGASALTGIINPAAALAFLVFTLLYMPCVAAFAVIKRELGSFIGAAMAMVSQTGIAWLVAFAVYHIAVKTV